MNRIKIFLLNLIIGAVFLSVFIICFGFIFSDIGGRNGINQGPLVGDERTTFNYPRKPEIPSDIFLNDFLRQSGKLSQSEIWFDFILKKERIKQPLSRYWSDSVFSLFSPRDKLEIFKSDKFLKSTEFLKKHPVSELVDILKKTGPEETIRLPSKEADFPRDKTKVVE